MTRPLFSESSLKCHQNRDFQHPSSLESKTFYNFSRSYRLSVQCKFENTIISTVFRECHKTEAFHRVSVLLRGVDETETLCLDSVGETTEICCILTFEQNSVNLFRFRNLHCTESLNDREKL